MKPINQQLNAFLQELRKPNVLTTCQHLSEKSMTKVCIITDIGKTLKMHALPKLTPEEFDVLYDTTLDKLEHFGSSLQGQIAFAKSNDLEVTGIKLDALLKP